MSAADLVLRSPTGRRLTLWAGLGAAALALRLHLTLEAFVVNTDASLGGDLAGHLDGKPVSVPEPEGHLSGEGAAFLQGVAQN